LWIKPNAQALSEILAEKHQTATGAAMAGSGA